MPEFNTSHAIHYSAYQQHNNNHQHILIQASVLSTGIGAASHGAAVPQQSSLLDSPLTNDCHMRVRETLQNPRG